MGTEDVAKKGFFSSKATFKNRSTIFTLGNRDTVLTTELEDPIIVIPQAQKTEKKVREGRGVREGEGREKGGREEGEREGAGGRSKVSTREREG